MNYNNNNISNSSNIPNYTESFPNSNSPNKDYSSSPRQNNDAKSSPKTTYTIEDVKKKTLLEA